jgi:hypothetical protein
MLIRRVLITFVLFVNTVYGAIEDYSIGAGQVTLNDVVAIFTGGNQQSISISFPSSSAFGSPPAVFILPDNSNPDPMTLRVHSVTTTGFEVFVSESEGEDSTYPAIDFDYLAVEAGTYTIGASTIYVGIEIGVTNVVGINITGTYQTIAYPAAYPGTNPGPPVVITQLQSLNSDSDYLDGSGNFSGLTEPFLELAQTLPTLANFTVALERAQTTAGTISGSGETVAWMSITREAEILFDDDADIEVNLKAFYSSDSVNGNCRTVTLASGGVGVFGAEPIVFGSQVKRDGSDGGWLRRCSSTASSVKVQIEEDRALNSEQNHTTEQVNFIAMSQAFVTTVADVSSPPINMVVASGSIPLGDVIGSLSYTLTPTTVSFSSLFGANFSATPAVIPMSTNQGNGEPAFARVWNVTPAGFTIAQTIPQGTTVPAGTMTVDFMAAVPGIHTLPEGSKVVSGIDFSVLGCVGGASGCTAPYETQLFGTTLTNPAVIAAGQSIANDPTFDPVNNANPLLAVSIVNVSNTDFDLAVEYAKTSLGAPLANPETIGWIAMDANIEAGLHAAEGTTPSGSHLIEIRTVRTATNIQGWDDGACDSNDFSSPFTLTVSPLVVATQNIRNGTDGGWLRKCSQSATNFTLVIDEDSGANNNRSHLSAEFAGVLAFSEQFAWTPATYSNMKLGATFSDPVNGTNNPKAIPQAEIDYTVFITATSRIGIDNDTVSVTDAIPVNTELFVGDLVGGCPIDIVANTAGVSFACATDLLLLGGTAVGCTPDGDGYCPFSTYTFGTDWSADVASIKVNPKGEFSGSTGVGVEPQFTFRFRVRLN